MADEVTEETKAEEKETAAQEERKEEKKAKSEPGIEEKIKETISRGAMASKNAFSKAGDAVQRFSDKSVLKFEKKQLEGRRTKKYTELGMALSALLLTDGADIKNLAELSQKDDSALAALEKLGTLQSEITELSSQIQEKNSAINEVG